MPASNVIVLGVNSRYNHNVNRDADRPHFSGAARPKPSISLVSMRGLTPEAIASACRDDGLHFEVIPIDRGEPDVEHDLKGARIRLYVRMGLVVRAEQG